MMGDSGGANMRSVKLIRVVRLVRLMKLMKLFKLGNFMEEFTEATGISPAAVQLVQLMFKIMFVAHLLSCAMFFIGTPVCGDVEMADPLSPCTMLTEEEREQSWVLYKGLDYLSLKSRYIASFHWVTATMMSVGYGDLFAMNTVERLYSVFVMVVGATAFGFILSIVTVLLDSTSNREQASRRKNEELKEWMLYRDVPEFLRKRIKEACTYTWSQKSILNEEEILAGLPTKLRNEIVETVHAGKLEVMQGIFDGEGISFQLELVQHLGAQQLQQHETLLEPWETTLEVYFIAKGVIEGILEPTKHGKRSSVMKRASARASHRSSRHSAKEAASKGDEILAGVFEDGHIIGHSEPTPLKYRCFKICDMLVVKKETLKSVVERFPGSEDRFSKEVLSRNRTMREVLSLPTSTAGDRLVQQKVWHYGEVVEPDELPNEVLRPNGNMGRVGGQGQNKPRLSRTSGQSSLGHSVMHTKRPSAFGMSSVGADDNTEEAEESNEDLLKRWIIPPTNKTKLKWDLLVGLFIIYSVIIIPYRIGFGVDTTELPAIIFDIFVDICFLLDMVLMFRTAFTDAVGVVDTCPAHIRSRYLRGWFWIDLFSTFPFDRVVEAFLSSGDSSKARAVKLIRVVRLARLLKLVRMLKMGPIMKHFDEVVGNSPLLVKFSKLAVSLVLLGHLIGCFWYFVAMSSDSTIDSCEAGQLLCDPSVPATTWYEAAGITPEMRDSQYCTAFYWAFTTMTTVGYGDITPMSDNERLYAITMMIAGATVFGYISGSIAALASQENGGEALIHRRVSTYLDYCEEQTVCARTADAVKLHYNYFFEEKSPFAEAEILDELPNSLRKAAILHMHQDVIEKICLLSPATQPDWFIASVVRLLEPQAYVPEEAIIKPANPQREIFFVYDGLCEEWMIPSSSSSPTPTVSKAPSPEPGEPLVSCDPSSVMRALEAPAQSCESDKEVVQREDPPSPEAPSAQKVESSTNVMPGVVPNAAEEPEAPLRDPPIMPAPLKAFDNDATEEWGQVRHVYNSGCVFGVDSLLDNKNKYLVTCSDKGPCFLYVLKDVVLANVAAWQPELVAALQKALAEAAHEQTISGRPMRNAERRILDYQHRDQFDKSRGDYLSGTPQSADSKNGANGCKPGAQFWAQPKSTDRSQASASRAVVAPLPVTE